MVDKTAIFDEYRALLFSIAYRMLGSVMDAEDMVQETFVRWYSATTDEVLSPKAYLSATITRLCIDYLKSARVKRESYVGAWLPEPLVTENMPDVASTVEMAESLSLAFLRILEKLTPLERAVFLLRQVFDYDYSEIAEIVGKSPANCRQIVKRAQDHLKENRPRYDVTPEQRKDLTHKFLVACATGDMNGLVTMLSEDVIMYSDGGGKVSAALNPIYGADKVIRLMLGVSKKAPPGFNMHFAEINGEYSAVFYIGDKLYSVMNLEFAGGKIKTIYQVLNPDKLQKVADSLNKTLSSHFRPKPGTFN
jgi:RNA polymerase sigma-70 factor, ECF subfamily